MVDNDDDSAVAAHRLNSWSIPSTSRARCDIQLGRVRGSSRSASDIHQMAADVVTTSSHGAGAEMSLRLSGCGAERSVQAKRRVIKMLFVVVAEYFICWTPMYVLQTWFVFDHDGAVNHVSPGAMNLVHLLGFASACCHPITYGFMNASFRRGFAAVFCRRRLAGAGGGGALTGVEDDRVQSARRQLTSFVDREHGTRPAMTRNCRAL